ncbi:hemagglutinin repeat-containing protein [Ciceribacter sp. RN22]|uniref:hemagglutinin repeat-containing protein n=1 Tax=Ciceribacter sp. RN22 TaxID=2954932 RepID=UPI002091E769|nr:hemagglutinin repeat-containing protein [Ciceribacter sp. RN22]MCO6181125.1 hemagglutinin repeat-containing protein [Ciceribacter sp. RN22]
MLRHPPAFLTGVLAALLALQPAVETASGSSIRGGSGVAVSAGNDVTVSASTLSAGSADQTADLTIAAGGNIVVSSGKDVLDQDTQSRGHGFLQSNEWSSEVHDETTVASRLGASGTVTLDAGKTVAIAGSEVTAGEDIAIAGESVAIIGAQEAHDLAIGKETSGLFAGSGDGFFSIWGEEEKEKSGSAVVNAGSMLTAGGNVSVTARARDIDIVGSGIAAGGDIALSAANDVNVTPGAESAMSQETEKRSGFGISLSSGNGSASIGIGYGSAEDEVTQSSGTNAVSTLSAGRDITITAGNDVNLQAAKVEAGQDIALYALNDVNLLSAQDETNYAHRHEEFFAGISLNVQSSLISAGQQLADSASGLGDANGLYSLAPTALAAYKAGTALQQAGDGGSLGSASLTIGFTQQKTLETASSTSPVPTTLRSGGSVAIVAEEGSITGHGVQIAAGFDASGNPVATTDPSAGNILLSAGEEIALYSAQGSTSTGFSATSSGASFGIDLGTGLPVASGSYVTGEGDGTGVYNLNSHVTGTGTVVINSGADTVLKGAVVSGETVIANVGGDLKIESVQDTAAYDEQSLGISAGFGPSGLSGGFNKGTVTGDFANVAEQSGIVAGSGGYHVAVEGGVDLIGGVIASTDTTGNSSLSADHLTYSDLRNSSSASTSNIGLSASLPLPGSDAANAPLGGLAITPAVGQPAMESDGGTARATLTPGTLSLSSQTQDLAGLNTDLSKANTQVEIYDIDELKAKQRSAAALSELLNIGVGTLSEKLGFDEGSPEKVALHAAIGALTAELAGGNAATGALAGGASEIANGVLAKVLKANPNLNEAQQAAITQWVAAAVGAAVGGELGAATALDNVNYNYLNHDDAEKLTEAKAACKNGDKAACEQKARLEKKDEDQQKQYLTCRSTGFAGAGCDAVFKDVIVALSSYSGIAPFDLSKADRLAILDSDGNLDQLVKILAPYGAASLPDGKQKELAKLINYLTGDNTGFTATPWTLEQIASGDPSSLAQVLGIITHNTAVAGLGKLVGKVDNGEVATNKTQLIDDLMAGGTKVTPENVVDIQKLPDGRTVWLESGTADSGLQHIVARHGDEFRKWGVPEADIPDFVGQALRDNNVVGTSSGAPVYLVGDVPTAVVVSDNGYIVTAYPVTKFERY